MYKGGLMTYRKYMLSDSVQKLVESCDGAVAGVLMGPDDMEVESFNPGGGPLDIQAIGSEFSFVLGQIRRAADILEIGSLEEVTVRSENLIFLIRILDEDYFLGLVLKAGGNLGKGRYLLRMAQPEIQAELH